MSGASRTALLVVSGGVSAYKSAVVARELGRRGLAVETVLTPAAQRFVTPLTFAAITGRAPWTELWDPRFSGEVHIDLTSRADLVVVAPATADLMARAAAGLADDLATTCLLSAKGPLVFAPAMHPRMWSHPATRANVDALVARGAVMVGPVVGPLASGESGMGRMAEPEAIVDAAVAALAPRDLAGARLLVTAGGTHEAIDPVRFVGNRSSGRMGYAIAAAARDRGAAVTVVAGPTAIAPPAGVEVERVRSAAEMHAAVNAREGSVDVIVMAAAVADYRPAEVADHKIKKGAAELSIRLVANPDILASLGAARAARGGARPVLVGFAVETGDLVALARGKLSRKGCDLVVANRAEDGFEGESNRVVLVDARGDEALPVMPKREVAGRILDRVVELLRRGA